MSQFCCNRCFGSCNVVSRKLNPIDVAFRNPLSTWNEKEMVETEPATYLSTCTENVHKIHLWKIQGRPEQFCSCLFSIETHVSMIYWICYVRQRELTRRILVDAIMNPFHAIFQKQTNVKLANNNLLNMLQTFYVQFNTRERVFYRV